MSERLKVLVADDQPDSLDLLRELLTVYNFELRVARNGLEAIGIGLKWEPDLLITDIDMPDADGRHLAGRLKVSLPALIAIAVSGTANGVCQVSVIAPISPNGNSSAASSISGSA